MVNFLKKSFENLKRLFKSYKTFRIVVATKEGETHLLDWHMGPESPEEYYYANHYFLFLVSARDLQEARDFFDKNVSECFESKNYFRYRFSHGDFEIIDFVRIADEGTFEDNVLDIKLMCDGQTEMSLDENDFDFYEAKELLMLDYDTVLS